MWLFAVDFGDVLTVSDCEASRRFRERRGPDGHCAITWTWGVHLHTPAALARRIFPFPQPSIRIPPGTRSRPIRPPSPGGELSVGRQRRLRNRGQLVRSTRFLVESHFTPTGAIRVPPSQPSQAPFVAPEGESSRVIAVGNHCRSVPPALQHAVAFEPARAVAPRIAQSNTFHHFAINNWDTTPGSELRHEPPGDAIIRNTPGQSRPTRYVVNVARGGRNKSRAPRLTPPSELTLQSGWIVLPAKT